MTLRHNDYLSVSMIIFLVIGLGHLWRAFQKLSVQIGDTSIAVEVSWIAGLVALYLAYSAYKLKH